MSEEVTNGVETPFTEDAPQPDEVQQQVENKLDSDVVNSNVTTLSNAVELVAQTIVNLDSNLVRREKMVGVDYTIDAVKLAIVDRFRRNLMLRGETC